MGRVGIHGTHGAHGTHGTHGLLIEGRFLCCFHIQRFKSPFKFLLDFYFTKICKF